MNVLLVDDSKIMRTLQRRTLASLGECNFYEAGDGEEALQILSMATAPIDFALVDWNMPKMDGITLVRKIRETNKVIPLIMCTTEAEKPRVIEALQAGVNNYAIKPFTPEQLISRVQQTLAKASPSAQAA